MDQGFAQLLLLAVILLAALLDLFVRRLKRKAVNGQPTPVDEELFGVEDDNELSERTLAESQPPTLTQPSMRASMLPFPRAHQATAVSPRRRRGGLRSLTRPIDARRGIVLMAILGPCRGLDAPTQRRNSPASPFP